MSNEIVTVNVSVTKAPAPVTLQQTGAIISQGATTLGTDAYQILEEASDLTAILAAALSAASATWVTNVVTVTASAPLPAHLPVGAEFVTTLAGFAPVALNKQFLATVTGPSGAGWRRRIRGAASAGA